MKMTSIYFSKGALKALNRIGDIREAFFIILMASE